MSGVEPEDTGGAGARDIPHGAIGQRAFGGIAWTIVQTLSAKAATILQQLILAKLYLSEDDFGLVAMSQVIISLASLGQNLGVGEILVRRHRSIEKWAQPGFWLNFAGGLVGMLLVLMAAWIWPWIFAMGTGLFGNEGLEVPRIEGLLLVWSLWLPLDAIATVFRSRLRVAMRFRELAILYSANAIALAVISVILAAMGWGPYSLIAPLPVLALGMVLATWRLSGMRVSLRIQVGRWRYILRDSRYFLITNFFNSLLQQGDYMLTGFFFSKSLLGAYYWAYRMSTQTQQLIGGNFMSVLVPSFAKLDEDQGRQLVAYQRTCATMLFVGMPICFLQAIVAEPLFHLFFGAKWDRALPLFEYLSIGMGFALPQGTPTSLLLAQGRYLFHMVWSICTCAVFMSFVLAGALLGSIEWVAMCVTVYFVIFGPMSTVMPVLRSGVGPWSFLWRVYGFSTVACCTALAASWGVSMLLAGVGDMAMLAARTVACLGTYAMIVMLVRPQVAKDLWPRLRIMLVQAGLRI